MSLKHLLCLNEDESGKKRRSSRNSYRIDTEMKHPCYRISDSKRSMENLHTQGLKTPEKRTRTDILNSTHYLSKLFRSRNTAPKTCIKGANLYDINSKSFRSTSYSKEKFQLLAGSLKKVTQTRSSVKSRISVNESSPLKRTNDRSKQTSLMATVMQVDGYPGKHSEIAISKTLQSKRPINGLVLGLRKQQLMNHHESRVADFFKPQNSPTINPFSMMDHFSPSALMQPAVGLFRLAEIKQLTEKELNFQRCRRIIIKVAFRITALKRTGYTNEEVRLL